MNRPTESQNRSEPKAVRNVVIELLRSRNAKARFMTEVHAAMEKARMDAAETERALAELESEALVMVRDHFCADPHLAGVDLRVVTVVAGGEGEDPQLGAIRRIDEAWNKWLSEYLANHRCG